MKTKWILFTVLVTLFLGGTNRKLHAQVFSGFDAFAKIIEFEGQRFLMDEVYKVTTTNIEHLFIDKTFTEIDRAEGFMFVLTSYIYNDKRGAVFTAFNSISFQNDKHLFTNIHVTNQELIELNELIEKIVSNKIQPNEHLLKVFNERLIVDINKTESFTYIILWVDIHSRHTFTEGEWYKAFKRYQKFVEN